MKKTLFLKGLATLSISIATFFSCTVDEKISTEEFSSNNESFTVTSGNKYYLKNNGNYVSHNKGTEPMTCDRPEPGEWEQFYIREGSSGGYWYIKSISPIASYVSSENGKLPIMCDRPEVLEWEKFTIEYFGTVNGNDVVAFKARSNDSYISSEYGAGQVMTCNRPEPGDWEKFELVPVDGESTGGSTGETTAPTGSDPWDFFENCKQWKITWVDASEEKDLCSQGEKSAQYEVSPNGDALVFTVPLNEGLGTTSGSTDYSRSELREREEDGGSDIYWTTDGNHALYIQQAITHLPIKKDDLVAGQIHGHKDEVDDSMVLRLEGNHLLLSFNGNELRDNLTIKSNYTLGTKFEVIFEIIDGKHYCYYSEDGNLRNAYNNGSASSYYVKDGSNTVLMDLDYDQVYFKVGNYTQSSEDDEDEYFGRSDNYGQVYVYAFNVNHSGGDL